MESYQEKKKLEEEHQQSYSEILEKFKKEIQLEVEVIGE